MVVCVQVSISPWKDLVLWQSLYKFSLVATETHPFIAACSRFVKRVVHLCTDLGDTGGPRHEVGADQLELQSWPGHRNLPMEMFGVEKGGAVNYL